MKPTLTILALATTLSASAQCTELTCSDATNLATIGSLSTSYDGSTCFSGIGEVPNWVNVNNWQTILVDGEIDYKQNINFGSLSNKLASNGNNTFNYISMDGSDTVYVKGGTTQVETIVSNNSWEGNWNTVAVDEGSEFYYNGILISPGATILTGGGTGNAVKVIAGCSDDPLPIKDTKWYGYVSNGSCVVSWNTDTDGTLQYSTDGKRWENIRHNAGYIGQIEVDAQQHNFFRLFADGHYSEVFYLQNVVGKGLDGVQVDVLGRPVKAGAAGIYFGNGDKKVKL